MNEHGVTVSRLTVNCIVPRDHPNLARVRWKLDEVARSPLQEALAELLEPLSRLRRDDVLIIQRLELSFDLDTSRPVDELARRWASRVAAELAWSLEGARSSLVRFPDAAHYLARFLVDTAAGRAAHKWYYRRYRGLDLLATSAALRTALLEDPERGLSALGSLAPADLIPVLEALGPHEAQRVIETVAGSPGEGGERAVDALIAAAPHWRVFAHALHSPWTAALALLALACAPPPGAASPAVIAPLAASVAAWVKCETEAREVVGESPPPLAPLGALAPPRQADLAAAFGKASDESRSIGVDPVAEFTPFGGLLLLLPHVAALPIDEVWRDSDERASARLAVLARCAGAARAERVASDPLVRRLCGVVEGAPIFEAAQEFADALEQGAVSRARTLRLTVGRERRLGGVCITVTEPEGCWSHLEPLSVTARASLRSSGDLRLATARANTAALGYFGMEAPALTLAAQHVLRAFARRLPGFSESSPAYLYENFLDFSATVEHAGGRSVCRMGRPPLAALLGFTGTLRGRIVVPWLEPLELWSGG